MTCFHHLARPVVLVALWIPGEDWRLKVLKVDNTLTCGVWFNAISAVHPFALFGLNGELNNTRKVLRKLSSTKLLWKDLGPGWLSLIAGY